MRYSWLNLLIDALATWRLGRLVTVDDFPPIKHARDWVLRRWPGPNARFSEAEVIVNEQDVDSYSDEPLRGHLEGTGLAVEWLEEGWQAQQPHWFGQLIDCIWCASVWLAGGVVALRALLPVQWGYLALVLAFAGVAGLIATKIDK